MFEIYGDLKQRQTALMSSAKESKISAKYNFFCAIPLWIVRLFDRVSNYTLHLKSVSMLGVIKGCMFSKLIVFTLCERSTNCINIHAPLFSGFCYRSRS